MTHRKHPAKSPLPAQSLSLRHRQAIIHRRSAPHDAQEAGAGDGHNRTPNPRKKQIWNPATLLSPVPVAMVSCVGADGKPNIITVAWVGTVCSNPPMVSISLRPATLSHSLIRETGEFVVNIPSSNEANAMDFCGVASGRNVDKFEKTGLTPVAASRVSAPLIAQCPLHLECTVRQTLELGSHTMFIGEVLAVQAAEDLIDASGRFALEKAGLVAYAHGHYYALGRSLGHFGFSVRKKRKSQREGNQNEKISRKE